jgi:hypothetical protein
MDPFHHSHVPHRAIVNNAVVIEFRVNLQLMRDLSTAHLPHSGIFYGVKLGQIKVYHSVATHILPNYRHARAALQTGYEMLGKIVIIKNLVDFERISQQQTLIDDKQGPVYYLIFRNVM